jgi:dihydrofolate reductase
LKLSLIAAVADNGTIGRNGQLPWYLPEDLKYFKRVTLGKPVIMGRKTWESIGRPLPGRTNIVISRQPDYCAEGARVVASLPEALKLAESIAEIDGAEEAMVIGGEEIYRLALPLADRLYITEVHAEVDGDACFPPWERSEWREVRREQVPIERSGDPAGMSSPGNTEGDYAYSFVVYQRRH